MWILGKVERKILPFFSAYTQLTNFSNSAWFDHSFSFPTSGHEAFESNRIRFESDWKLNFAQNAIIHYTYIFHWKHQPVISVTCMPSKFSICDKLMLSCIWMSGKMHLGMDCDTEAMREKFKTFLYVHVSCCIKYVHKYTRERRGRERDSWIFMDSTMISNWRKHNWLQIAWDVHMLNSVIKLLWLQHSIQKTNNTKLEKKRDRNRVHKIRIDQYQNDGYDSLFVGYFHTKCNWMHEFFETIFTSPESSSVKYTN